MKKRRATMADVANHAGVSRTTVSFVLNNVPDANIPEATRQRILQSARELDYAPNVQALNLATGRTMMIALVVRQTSEQMAADLFLGEFMRGATRIIEADDYHLLVHAAEPDAVESTYGKLVRTHKVDGLLVASPMVEDPEVQLLHDEGTPIVLNGATDARDIASVDVDNVQGAYTAVRHLIELGHRRIGHISNAPFSYTSSVYRLAGYRQALHESGISYDEQLVFAGEFTTESGYVAMQHLIDNPVLPTAVFIGSDVVAIGALDALHHHGLSIPRDMSVVSFDDILLSKYVRPALTTVHLPAYDLGRNAGEMILKIIRRQPLVKMRVLLPTELIVRDSTARLSV
ncbi:MAG: LacI family transcriptional regulator [Anaerolineae bacterium]|nr:LacI family transcriptional regulator [Anaerolineae bacterium]